MQKIEQKKSPVKQRILQFIDTLNITKRDFYRRVGVSRGTLESNTGITEDILAKFIATFPEISLEWLIQGTGEMIREKSNTMEKQDQPIPMTHVDELTRILQTQAATLLEQQRFINEHFRQDGIETFSPPHEYTEYPDNKKDNR